MLAAFEFEASKFVRIAMYQECRFEIFNSFYSLFKVSESLEKNQIANLYSTTTLTAVKIGDFIFKDFLTFERL